ncbi:MAG: CDP-alcohol phosphatidyltransferase family protein [Candidatus Methanofastidiosa archaeon]|nr:CDP-alcohol phosphatidyltransferase family protein [Candidatus Methanofastidiosa archaeon]
MLARYRERYQSIFSGLGRMMASTRLSPNFFTALSLVPALIMGYFFYIGDVFWGLIFILVSSLFDVIDGNVARATGNVTVFGKVFDHTIDRYVEFILIGGIVLGGLARPLIGFIAISGMLMASYVRAKAESEGARNCDIGLMDRAEKILIIMVGCIVYGWYEMSVDYALLAVGILSHITVIQRLLYSKKQFEVIK